jgi:uncharacterized cupin superfamily protein
MILRKGSVAGVPRNAAQAADLGALDQCALSDAGGLTQYGVYAETLHPGARSSDRHWHEREDEFLYMLAGEATLIDNDGPHLLQPGDAVAWKAGTPDGHHIVNNSDAPCSYLIMGTRVPVDVVHYPDLDRTFYHGPDDWRVIDNATGRILRQGDL